jgi:C1A family cysteine protease
MALEALNPNTLQELIRSQGRKWTAGDTPVSALSEPEKRRRLGYVPTGPLRTIRAGEAAEQAGAYPATYDLRNVNGSNYITPIRDQGNCGSCVSFGTTAAVEGTYEVVQGDPNTGIDLSEAQLFYCGGGPLGVTCETGWEPDPALNYIVNTGLVDEACFPYTAGDQACSLCSDWQSRVMQITAFHQITSTSDMKTWISSNGPLTACFAVYNDFFSYVSGVYTHVTGDFAGGHCVCCVGYDDNQGCWICKNSWGPGWGESGFFQIAYGEGKYPDGTGGIDSVMWAVDGIVATG